MGGGCTGAVNVAAEVRPSDSLKVRHHQGGGNSFSAYVSAKDPHSFLTKIEKVV
jgi:hypothetical protein